jgi:hypothetical protein
MLKVGIHKKHCVVCNKFIKVRILAWNKQIPYHFKIKKYCSKKCATKFHSSRGYKKNKLKFHCRSKTRFLIKKGIIKKQACEKCGNEKVQIHHVDYTKPEKIKWLCLKHHWELHRKLSRTEFWKKIKIIQNKIKEEKYARNSSILTKRKEDSLSIS